MSLWRADRARDEPAGSGERASLDCASPLPVLLMRRLLPLAFAAALFASGCSPSDDPAPEAADQTAQEAGESAAMAQSACEPLGGQDLPSPGACATATMGTTEVEVQYHSPSMKGRDVFGALVPYDQVWRTGANEATTLTTSGPLQMGGETVPAGTYSLFTIPSASSEWTIVLNSVAEQWGAFEYDEAQDVARTAVTPTSGSPAQERLAISFEDVTDSGATMVIAWDDVRVPVSVSTAG